LHSWRPEQRVSKPLMRKLTDDLNVSEFEMLGDLPEKDRTKRFVLAQMRIQTSVIRNLAYPDQTVRHLKNIFAGPLERIIASQYKGVSIERVIDALGALAEQADERLNDHIKRVRPVAIAKDFETTYDAYMHAFQDILEDRQAGAKQRSANRSNDARRANVAGLYPAAGPPLRFNEAGSTTPGATKPVQPPRR